VRGWIGVGIQDIESEMAEVITGYDKKGGVIITQIGPGMPADKAGVKAGDVVLEFNGIRIKDSNHLRNVIANGPVDKYSPLKVLRKGKIMTLKIKPTKQPKKLSLKAGGTSGTDEGDINNEELSTNFGIKVQPLSDQMAEKFGYENVSGVLISDVSPDSSAADKGLTAGMLIVEVEQQTVRDMESFSNALKKAKGKERVLFRIMMGESARYVVLKKKDKK
jgi:serine protease Do